MGEKIDTANMSIADLLLHVRDNLKEGKVPNEDAANKVANYTVDGGYVLACQAFGYHEGLADKAKAEIAKRVAQNMVSLSSEGISLNLFTNIPN